MCEIDRGEGTISVSATTTTKGVFDRSNWRFPVPQGRTDRNIRPRERLALVADGRSNTAAIEVRFEFEVVENAHVRRDATADKNDYRLGETESNKSNPSGRVILWNSDRTRSDDAEQTEYIENDNNDDP